MDAQELPEFAPPEGESRPMTFKRVLLNTCQEEFEGAHEARQARTVPLSFLLALPYVSAVPGLLSSRQIAFSPGQLDTLKRAASTAPC